MISVMIVDDQPLILAGIAMLLSTEPDVQIVAQVGDGVAAVREAALLQPDIVIMDVRMPVMDGVEATRQIAADGFATNRSGRIAVLILTTYHADAAVHAALRAGASGFLLKDALPTELVAAVRALSAGDAWLQPVVARGLLAEFAARPEPHTPDPHVLERLTPRERQVLVLVAQGLSNAEIASRLSVAQVTVKTHLGRILTKLDLRDRAQAVMTAYEHGLVLPGQQPPDHITGDSLRPEVGNRSE